MSQHAGKSLTRNQILGYLLLCLIWGSTWLAIRFLVQDVPPLKAAAIRFLIAAVLLLSPIFFSKTQWPNGARQWNAILALSVTLIALPYGLLFWAEQYVTSAMTALLFSAMPLAVAMFTPLMMHRKVPRGAVFAMVIAFGGILALVQNQLSANRRALWGGVAVLAAVVLSSWSVVFAKKRLQDVAPVISTGMQFLCAAVVLFWGTWALESHRQTNWTPKAVLALVFLATIGSAVAFAVYYWLLKQMQPYQLSTMSLVIPIIAVVEGSLFARETVPLMMIICMVVVLGAVGMVLRAEAAEAQVGDRILFVPGETE
ncbi:MAG TPA: EamA family transporter [Verrucomicrobiae bacterium]|jgi:drug/metabolite transporter (DMT)-like permease|nr:EamA family transporter [Verrucomicrobiae bacterium]